MKRSVSSLTILSIATALLLGGCHHSRYNPNVAPSDDDETVGLVGSQIDSALAAKLDPKLSDSLFAKSVFKDIAKHGKYIFVGKVTKVEDDGYEMFGRPLGGDNVEAFIPYFEVGQVLKNEKMCFEGWLGRGNMRFVVDEKGVWYPYKQLRLYKGQEAIFVFRMNWNMKMARPRPGGYPNIQDICFPMKPYDVLPVKYLSQLQAAIRETGTR